MNAALLALGERANMDSPKNMLPRETPYRPPTRSPEGVPSFNAVGKAQFVQFDVGLDKVIGDPCAFVWSVRTTLNDPFKFSV